MINLIVAYDKNRAIGKNGTIPWDISSEIKKFKQLTTNNIVIMGRKTFDSIGRALPNRINIVVSNKEKYSGENLYTATNITEAINMFKGKEIFIIGGANIYKEALDIVDRMYISQMDIEVEDPDTFFPYFDENLYEKHIDEVVKDKIDYTYLTYIKKTS